MKTGGADGMYITHPGFGRSYHIFTPERDQSLCGKAMMLRVDPNHVVPFTGKEEYRKGEDCKACFREAGLKVD